MIGEVLFKVLISYYLTVGPILYFYLKANKVKVKDFLKEHATETQILIWVNLGGISVWLFTVQQEHKQQLNQNLSKTF